MTKDSFSVLDTAPPLQLLLIFILASSCPHAVAAQNSTLFECNVCGDDGSTVTNLDGIVVVPPLIELTCAELLERAELGDISEEQCLEISLVAQEACDCLYTCPLCGDGRYATNPEGIVFVPSEASTTCEELGEKAFSGNISIAECEALQPFVTEPCGCVEVAQSLSIPPSDSPSFGQTPPCWTDLDDLNARMKSEEGDRDISVQLEIILCPDTVFTFGYPEYENFTYVAGFRPINPQPNTHWKCGEDGALSNNCTFREGVTAITLQGLFRPGEDIIFQGIVFAGQTVATFLGGAAGDVTFRDCLWRVSTEIEIGQRRIKCNLSP
jgi:hypothetical protein